MAILAPVLVHNGAGAVMVVLDHAEGGHMLQRRTAQRGAHRADLPAPAVDEQQIRQRGELVGRAVRFVAAARRLVFGGAAGERLGSEA